MGLDDYPNLCNQDGPIDPKKESALEYQTIGLRSGMCNVSAMPS